MIFLKALFSALFKAILDAFEADRIRRDHDEALIENARRDAEALVRAGEDATRERMRNAEAMASDDDGALRDWLRARDPGTR